MQFTTWEMMKTGSAVRVTFLALASAAACCWSRHISELLSCKSTQTIFTLKVMISSGCSSDKDFNYPTECSSGPTGHVVLWAGSKSPPGRRAYILQCGPRLTCLPLTYMELRQDMIIIKKILFHCVRLSTSRDNTVTNTKCWGFLFYFLRKSEIHFKLI